MTKKLRAWENDALAAAYGEALHVIKTIDELTEAQAKPPEELEPSIINTAMLLGLAESVAVMYELMTERELVTGGFSKENETFH